MPSGAHIVFVVLFLGFVLFFVSANWSGGRRSP